QNQFQQLAESQDEVLLSSHILMNNDGINDWDKIYAEYHHDWLLCLKLLTADLTDVNKLWENHETFDDRLRWLKYCLSQLKLNDKTKDISNAFKYVLHLHEALQLFEKSANRSCCGERQVVQSQVNYSKNVG